MNEGQQKYVYVIGAGFSAGLGYPLTGDLLVRFWERIDDRSFRDKLKHVIEFHNPSFNCEEFVSFPNVEELLSQMLVNDQLFDSSRQYEGNFSKDDLADLQRTLLLKIADWFHEISRGVQPSKPHVPWLKDFRDHVQGKNVGIISFNWDLVLDALLFGDRLHQTDYGFHLRPFSAPVLLKPHGSLNWFEHEPGQHIKAERKFMLSVEGGEKVYAFKKFRAPKSTRREYTPLIVPPVYLKNFKKPVFRSVWQNCTRFLSIADKVVFLGYSMSVVDLHAQFIMRCGFKNQVEGQLMESGQREEPTGAAEVVIVNPDRAAAERTRAIVGPQHKCRWISKPVADLTWEHL